MNANKAASAPFLSCAEVRELDRRAVEIFNIPGAILMENAGRSLVESFLRHLGVPANPHDDNFPKSENEKKSERILVLAGRGNNGGDGFVMARRLHFFGFQVEVIAVGPSDGWQNEAEMNRKAVEHLADERLSIRYFSADNRDAFESLPPSLTRADWIVDALLGTGVHGAPRPPIDRIISMVNASGKPVFAVDIPSGLDGDSGTAPGEAIRARITCTLAAVKKGLVLDSASAWVGRLELGDIGVAAEKLLACR